MAANATVVFEDRRFRIEQIEAGSYRFQVWDGERHGWDASNDPVELKQIFGAFLDAKGGR
jgi:hypothetical protein